jgi:hypothetical protein
MRGHFVAAILISAVGSLAANAADISGLRVGGDYGNYAPFGTRIEPVIIYDYEPGVIARSYWDAPWGNRHYFPSTGRRPKSGRLERVSSRRISHAEDYYRFWSVSSVFAPQSPPLAVRPYAIPSAPFQGSRH